MIQSKTFAAAALTGIGMAIAALTMSPSDGSARAVHQGSDVARLRIAEAFAVVPAGDVDPAIRAAARRFAKGNLLGSVACADETWPAISAACLLTANGSAVPAARTVTMGYQTEPATTVLMRLPTQQVASR